MPVRYNLSSVWVRCLIVKSPKISKAGDRVFKCPYRSEIWQVHRQQCNSESEFWVIEVLRDLTIRRLIRYWKRAQKWQSNSLQLWPQEANLTEALHDKQTLQPPRITPWGDTMLVGTMKPTGWDVWKLHKNNHNMNCSNYVTRLYLFCS